MSYSRYLRIPTPMQIGKSTRPTKTTFSTTLQTVPELLLPISVNTPEMTKLTAPLSSHFSCSRCSPAERR